MSQVVAPQPRVVVAFHSGYGHTAVLAEAVQHGAEKAGAHVTFVAVDAITDEQWHELDTADAVIFGTPTYMGGASAGFHAFAEASSGRYLNGTWADKIAAGFTNSASKSGDKLNTLNFLAAFAAQHRMIWVGLGLAPGWNALQASENDLNRLGFWVGAGAQTPQDGGIETVHDADIATAEHLGARVTAQAAALTVGRAALAEVTA
ncbi:flavodoxin family protein [Streptomyces sp. NBC_00365]|jgi:multimeric flavodoxin WrbA|uniref:flavodoxin family protein n=1 Tax=Streptomyces sp. NBC_00365 TaxID=2975726 RepID=UPI00224D1673|nr:flavodoxin family protein [Streptomyces sp. NBC_00365]MCX5087925.1 flavodoxin family protein [Streptomyces sp. NBC_00365]